MPYGTDLRETLILFLLRDAESNHFDKAVNREQESRVRITHFEAQVEGKVEPGL